MVERQAAEKSISILRSSPDQAPSQLAADGELLRPVFMGFATKNAKVIGIALGSLQRLIALQAVPSSAAAQIVATMKECMSQGVDIQLRILQTLLSLVTNFPSVHGELLGEVRPLSPRVYLRTESALLRLSFSASSSKSRVLP